MRNISLLFLFVFVIRVSAESDVQLVPYPNEMTLKKGEFNLAKQVKIVNSSSSVNLDFLRSYLKNDRKIRLKEQSDASRVILLDEGKQVGKDRNNESYCLYISPDTIKISSGSSTGIFYGIQTLRQLVNEEKATVPCVVIRDCPAYSWRAFMLDDARYFKGKQVVKQLLDKMAALKMNIFHWHLTDDQGWRLQIKKYPKLTEIGAKRDSSQIGGWESKQYDGKPHSGYYTQEDVREIVEYAAKRHITVVPEIEMPGHATAAVASYPFVGVLDHPIPVPGTFGIKSSVFNVADEKVIHFLNDVLDEVFQLFPGQVVHIGGDEIHFEEWKASRVISDYMKELNLKNYNELQLYFTNQMSRFVESRGRRMMGWNDIMGKNVHEWSTEADTQTGELAQNAIIHFWKGDSLLLREALEKGYDVVNSYHYFTYLDYDYDKLPLSKAYHFSPFPAGMDERYRSQLLGLGCQIWSEWVTNPKTLYRQVFPRLAAYSEVGWTQDSRKSYERFEKAYKSVVKLLDIDG